MSWNVATPCLDFYLDLFTSTHTMLIQINMDDLDKNLANGFGPGPGPMGPGPMGPMF